MTLTHLFMIPFGPFVVAVAVVAVVAPVVVVVNHVVATLVVPHAHVNDDTFVVVFLY